MVVIIEIVCICLLWTSWAFSQNYYFRASGSDSNPCTEAAPCRTTARAEALSCSPPTTYNFCGGEKFQRADDVFTVPCSGTSGNPITIQNWPACGSGNAIFTNAEVVTGWGFAGTDLWSKTFADNKSGANMSIDDELIFWSKSRQGASCPGAMTNDREGCFNGNTMYIRSSANPETIGSGVERWHVRGRVSGDEWKGISADGRGHVVVNNITVQKVDIGFLNIGWTTGDWEFNNTAFIMNGLASYDGGPGLAMFKFGQVNGSTTGSLTINTMTLAYCGRDCFDIFQDYPAGDVTINNLTAFHALNHGVSNLSGNAVPGARHEGTFIIDNMTCYNACSCIGLGNASEGGFENLIIRNSYFYDGVKNSDPLGNLYGVGCGSQDSAITSDNSETSINLTVAGNVFNNFDIGMKLRNDFMNLSAYNNTFYEMQVAGIRYDDGTAIKLRNNAFVNNDSFALQCSKGTGCPSISGYDIDYNYFFTSTTPSNDVFRFNGASYTLANAISGFTQWQSNNFGNLFGQSPTVFTDAPSADFTPASGSVLVDAGTTVGYPSFLSFAGIAPDVGGIESGIEPSPPAPQLNGAIIQSATPTLLEITFATDNPPMLPSTGCTGVTLSGTSAAPASCVRNATNTNKMDITLDQAPVATDTITLSYSQASGNITDSTPIEVADTAGFPVINNTGVNLLTASICSSSDTFATDRELAKSFDGDVTTEFGSSGCSCDPEFVIVCDLGVDHDMTLARLYGDALGTWWCQEWDLEYSSDGVAYTPFVTNTDCFGNQWWQQSLSGVTARYLRWTITGNTTDGRTQWRELEAYGVESGGAPPPPVVNSEVSGISISGARAR